MKFRLYCGLFKDGEWYNYARVKPLKGGALALLEGQDKSGAARLLNLIRGSLDCLLTEEGKELEVKEKDIFKIKVVDSWKIGQEQIKLVTGEEFPIIEENFYCGRCSRPELEHYTRINENWQKLIDKGFIDESFLENPEMTYTIPFPLPIEIAASKSIVGGLITSVTMQHLSLGGMLRIHKNAHAMSSEANMIYATWDEMIFEISGITEKDLNILKRVSGDSFSRQYFSDQENIDEIEEAERKNMLGIDAKDRKISCQYCNEEIGGYLDLSNFFSPLLMKKSGPDRQKVIQE